MTFKAGDKPKVIRSARQLEKLAEPGRYRDPEVKGLYLQIVSPRNRSWLLRYQFDKQPRSMGLGPYPLIGLTAARNKALEIRRNIYLDKTDPLAKRRDEQKARVEQRAKAQTFKQAAERFYEKAQLEWKSEGQKRTFRNSMAAYVYPLIGDLNVAAIDTAAVMRVLEPIWQGKPAVANLLRIRIEGILTMAAVGGYRAKGDNPARWKDHLSQLLPSHAKAQKTGKIRKTQSHAALPYGELRSFMAALRAQGDLAAMALEFIVLTAARKMEGLGATWDEIDMAAKLWTVPEARMKGGRAHLIPLSEAAVALLAALPREDGNPHLFIGARKGAALSDSLIRATLKRLADGATTHGFRSAFRDWVEDETDFPPHLAEIALAHIVGDKTERAYRRSDALEKRRELMEAWASYCGSAPQERGSVRGKVLPFKTAAGE